jgi:uncharacterized repeat protein (TIGR01451 family)
MRHSGAIYRIPLLMAILCAIYNTGCNSFQAPRIDPTGEHVFVSPTPAVVNPSNPYQYPPGNYYPSDDVVVILTPGQSVAPVGSEVVLVAGVGAADGYLRAYQRLEWSIAPGSAGQFVAVGKNDCLDVMLGDFNGPRIVNNTFAIGSTSGKDEQLTRGTPSPADDVSVTRGQGWISITSPVEGTSYVTVVAPEVVGWDARMKTAVIQWVDAVWSFPPPAINPAGTRHVFTTTVTRQSNQGPCPGWHVKYTITGGPPAGFMPDGAQSIEVPTDAAGQANVEIFQKSPAHGTNQISIEVIRPADLPGANGQSLVVGKGSTMKTWTAADIAVKMVGPAVGTTGSTLTYRIEVSNPGDLTAKEILVANSVPEGLVYLSGNPPAESGGRLLQWRLGELGPRQRRTIEVNYRAEREGSLVNCAEVTAAGGLKVSDCATTTVTAPAAAPGAIDLKVTGPSVATIGSDATFNILITNRGQDTATNLLVKDRFEPGLEHPASREKRIIEYELGDLAPGRSAKLELTFRVTQAGQLCHTVEVVRQDAILARSSVCLTASAEAMPRAGAAPPGIQPPSRTAPQFGPESAPGYQAQSAPAEQAPAAAGGVSGIVIRQTAPSQRMVNEIADFIIQIANTSNRTLTNLKVVNRADPALTPAFATEGYQIEGGNLMWLIPSLPAGSSVQLEIQFRCVKPTFKASNRVSISSSQGVQAEDEKSLEIRSASGALPAEAAAPGTTQPGETAPGTTPSSAELSVTVTDLRDPVAAGDELTYKIVVVNNSNVIHHQVEVVAMVPDGMVPAPLGTTGPGPTQFVIDRQTVSFNPVMEVRPGETLTYRVRVRARQAGLFHFRAELSSRELSQPVLQEETTEVF